MSNFASDPMSPGLEPVTLAPEHQGDYATLREVAFFDGVPNRELAALVASGELRRREVERDVVLTASAGAPLRLMVSGQVAVALFDAQELQQRVADQVAWSKMTKEQLETQSLLKPPPLARLAQKNLALFAEGDVFNLDAKAASDGGAIAFFTAAPSIFLELAGRAATELATRHAFFEARLRRAVQAGRQRLEGLAGVKQEILDFFLRQGISVAGDSVRVRQLDLCIDCKLCEEACEDRYGAKRLTLGGYQLGMLDFVYTCRTCTDQRCIDPCAYDSIKFDPDKREVVINEATCTGCTACAQACPYHAIDMVDVEDARNPTYRKAFKKRLDKKQALASGPGAGRVARARRIANKCDHCMSYGDQACVSACPTGSLIEVDPLRLFRERQEEVVAIAQDGYDRDVPTKVREILPTHAFVEGLAVRDGGQAKIRRGRAAPLLFWVVGLMAWLLCLGEILLRLYAPEKSLQFALLRQSPEMADLPTQAVLELIGYRAGDELAVQCGLVGAGLMIIAAIYPIFRRVPLFRWMASNTMYFDFHMMAGTVGPLFVLLHSALQLSSWVSAAFWSMVIVVLSGLMGRYLYTQVPDMSSGRELEELDHERAFARARSHFGAAMADLEHELALHRRRADEIAQTVGVIGSMFWLLGEDLARPFRRGALATRLRRAGVTGRLRRDLLRRAGRMMLIHRGRVIAPKAKLLLESWKKVHVPFTVALAGFAAVHIWVSWARAW